MAIDAQVEAPAGYQVHSSKSKVEDKFNFIAVRRGLYKFCFYNRNYVHENVDFDVHVGHHITDIDVQLVKDGEYHFNAILFYLEAQQHVQYQVVCLICGFSTVLLVHHLF